MEATRWAIQWSAPLRAGWTMGAIPA